MTAFGADDRARDGFLAFALAGDHRQCAAMLLEQLAAGGSLEADVVPLLVAAQREAGDRWLRGEWSVADEHVVTGATEAALDAVALELPPVASRPGGRIAMCCPEGEWHTVPGRMVAMQLRARGWSVESLGPSTPADDIGRRLARRGYLAVLASCSLSSCFLAVHRLIEVAHGQGTPVMVGGAALGSTARRANALGADSWADEIPKADGWLRSWTARSHRLAPARRLPPEALDLDIEADDLAAEALRRLPMLGVAAAVDPAPRGLLRDQLAQTVRHLSAAMLVGDLAVFRDHLAWVAQARPASVLPEGARRASLRALFPLLSEHSPAASAFMRGVSIA